MKSILQDEKYCFVCGSPHVITHHVCYGSGLRKISEKNGFKVYLCPAHHNTTNEGVHFNKALDLRLKRLIQAKYEETHSREDFIKLTGRNYLE